MFFGQNKRARKEPAFAVFLLARSLDSKKSSSKVDPILNAIRGGLTESKVEKMVQEGKDANTEAQTEFIRSLPACADIR